MKPFTARNKKRFVSTPAREIPGYPGYLITDLGEVISERRGKRSLLKPFMDRDGYRRVNLYVGGKMYQVPVHRLVLETFVGPCPVGWEARHFPRRDRWNADLANLSWTPKSVNMADKRTHGTWQGHAAHPMAKLSAGEVEQIRSHRGFLSGVHLASLFGIAKSHVSAIQLGRAWRTT